jgi:hypothetical protein
MDKVSRAANVGDGIVSSWTLVVADASNHSNGINVTAKRARLFLTMSSDLVHPVVIRISHGLVSPPPCVEQFRDGKLDSAMQQRTQVRKA